MCTDKVSAVKKMVLELDARGKRQVFNALLWDLVRADNTQYKFVKDYLEKSSSVCYNARGKHNNVFIADEDYNQIVAEYGAEFVARVVDQLSDKLKTGMPTKDHAVSLRIFCDAQKRHDGKKVPNKSTKEFMKHNYSAEIFKARNNDDVEF